MAFSRRRIHLKEQQRGADATTVGTLLLHVPGFLCGPPWSPASPTCCCGPRLAAPVLWIATGALAFHRPTEGFFARHVLGFRYPTRQERDRLAPHGRR